MRLPLEQVARVQSVGSQLEDAAKLPRRAGWPEAELLHQRSLLALDQLLQLLVELGELWVVLNAVQGRVVASVALVLPDVDYTST